MDTGLTAYTLSVAEAMGVEVTRAEAEEIAQCAAEEAIDTVEQLLREHRDKERPPAE